MNTVEIIAVVVGVLYTAAILIIYLRSNVY